MNRLHCLSYFTTEFPGSRKCMSRKGVTRLGSSVFRTSWPLIFATRTFDRIFWGRLTLVMASSSLNSYVSNLISEVSEAAKALPSDPFQDDQARKKLQALSQKLAGALEAPMDTIRKLNYAVISFLLHLPSQKCNRASHSLTCLATLFSRNYSSFVELLSKEAGSKLWQMEIIRRQRWSWRMQQVQNGNWLVEINCLRFPSTAQNTDTISFFSSAFPSLGCGWYRRRGWARNVHFDSRHQCFDTSSNLRLRRAFVCHLPIIREIFQSLVMNIQRLRSSSRFRRISWTPRSK